MAYAGCAVLTRQHLRRLPPPPLLRQGAAATSRCRCGLLVAERAAALLMWQQLESAWTLSGR
jgi:hypothetical protein